MQSAEASLHYGSAKRAWQMLVATVRDQFRDQRVGPGIPEFRVVIHKNSA